MKKLITFLLILLPIVTANAIGSCEWMPVEPATCFEKPETCSGAICKTTYQYIPELVRCECSSNCTVYDLDVCECYCDTSGMCW